ncbi:MAG TPA: META domain-containing protein [Vicinamibacterales bacterium]|nr:META domain-containing protein [Vicinamibacterales bacterium]
MKRWNGRSYELLHLEDSMSSNATGGARRHVVLPVCLWLVASAAAAQSIQRTAIDSPSLAGTSWRLVKFQGSGGTTLTPDDRSKYTIAFGAYGRLTARVDCNRGRGTWKSSGSNQLQVGALALTRAACRPASLHDQMVKQWGSIRSYVVRDGHLFLALMADGGIYEFEPLASVPVIVPDF